MNVLVVIHKLFPLLLLGTSVVYSTFTLGFAVAAAAAYRKLPALVAPYAVAFLWVGNEYFRSLGSTGCPWNYLGHTQVNLHDIIQWSDLVGVHGISYLVMLANAVVGAVISVALESRGRPTIPAMRVPLLNLFVVSAVIVAAFSFGENRRRLYANLESANQTDGTESARFEIALVQPNIPRQERIRAWTTMERTGRPDELSQKHWSILEDLTRQAGRSKPDLIVLPETTFIHHDFPYDQNTHDRLRGLADETGADILFGAINRMKRESYHAVSRRTAAADPDSTATAAYIRPQPNLVKSFGKDGVTKTIDDSVRFNSAWLVKPSVGLTSTVYNKLRLVPLTESAPLRGLVPYGGKLHFGPGFETGWEYTLFRTGNVRYGALICFESGFADLARQFVRRGAQMLMVLSNDAWMNHKTASAGKGIWPALFRTPGIKALSAAGPHQHVIQSVFRAIENRVPVVQAGYTGISAVIMPSGRMTGRLAYNESGLLRAAVPITAGDQTFYNRYGDWFAVAALGSLVLTLLAVGTGFLVSIRKR